MKKIIIIIIVLVVLLFPIKRTYKDGGSKEYSALLYKYICFHALDEYYESGYKEGCELHIFPTNFRSFDYYLSKDIHPEVFWVSNGIDKIKANPGSFEKCNKYDVCEKVIIDFADDKFPSIDVISDNKLTFTHSSNISSIKAYKDTFENYLDVYIEYSKYGMTCSLEEGNYIVEIKTVDGKNNALYYFRLHIK